MKRKINTIKGKRLVMGGGTNNLTKDEILVTETSNGIELKERSSDGSIKELAGGGSSSNSIQIKFKEPICYRLDNTVHNSSSPIGLLAYNCPVVVLNDGSKIRCTNLSEFLVLNYNPTEVWIYANNLAGLVTIEGFNSVREYVETFSKGEWTEISEEEFFKVWNEASEL